MEKHRIWELVAEDIQLKNPEKGKPSTWTSSAIKNFVEEMRISIRDRIAEDQHLLKFYKLERFNNDQIYNWAGISTETFRRIFLRKTSTGTSGTIDRFALYLGYKSGEDYINHKLKETPVEQKKNGIENNINPQLVSEAEKMSLLNSKKSKMNAVVFMVALIFFSTLWFFSKEDEGKSSGNHIVFVQNKSFNILILPFVNVASVVGQEYNIDIAVHGRFDEILSLSKADSLIEIQRLDTAKIYFTYADAHKIGKKYGADLVVWGEFEDYQSQKKQQISLNYSLIDNRFERVATLKGVNRKSSRGNIIEDLRVGSITGEIEDIVYASLGLVELSNGMAKNSIHYFDKIEIAPTDDFTSLYRLKAYAYYLLNKNSEAYESIKIANELDSTHRWSLNNAGVFARRLGKYNEAEMYFKKALNIDTNYYKAHSNIGNVYASTERYEQAIKSYDVALKLFPKDSFAVVNRGWVHYMLGHYEKAERDYAYYMRCDSTDSYIYSSFGELYFTTKDYDKSLKYFLKAETLGSNDIETYQFIADLYSLKDLPKKQYHYNSLIDSLKNF